MLEKIQIIKDELGKPKFAVVDYDELMKVKEILNDKKKLEEYLGNNDAKSFTDQFSDNPADDIDYDDLIDRYSS
jgi:hypothetical protein